MSEIVKRMNWDNVWRFGANFTPSTAINQLEMWQEDTFDPETIGRELAWAAKIGMNVMRVFLHDLLWEQDANGFLSRMDTYLKLADEAGIKTMFVLFDDCWNSDFKLGKQPDPKPFTHNSGWIQSPGTKVLGDPAQFPRLERYVKGVMTRFAHDSRVILWDLYNEPGNSGNGEKTLPLLSKVVQWAREVAPDQPITMGLWYFSAGFDILNHFMLDNSDIVSFHAYLKPEQLQERIDFMRFVAAGRPLFCSEYMARTSGSTFKDCLPVLRKNNVAAVNWGLVSGKTQTIYPYGWNEEKGKPDVWFHDVFQKDGKLLHPEEMAVFTQLADPIPFQ